MPDIKYQIIKIKVSVSGERQKLSADTDKKYQRLKGVFASLPNEEALTGSTMELKLADKELFPEGFEVKMLYCSERYVAPAERFYSRLDEEAEGNRMDITYQDGGRSLNYPYTALLYLHLEND